MAGEVAAAWDWRNGTVVGAWKNVQQKDSHQSAVRQLGTSGNPTARGTLAYAAYAEVHGDGTVGGSDNWAPNGSIVNVRCLWLSDNTLDPAPLTTGREYWYAFSVWNPMTFWTGGYTEMFWEIHQPNVLASPGIAPFAFMRKADASVVCRIATGNHLSGGGWSHQETEIPLGVGMDQVGYYDFMMHIVCSETSGTVEYWGVYRGTSPASGDPFTSTAQIVRTGIPTAQYDATHHDVIYYHESGLYPGAGTAINGKAELYHLGTYRDLTRAALFAQPPWAATGSGSSTDPPAAVSGRTRIFTTTAFPVGRTNLAADSKRASKIATGLAADENGDAREIYVALEGNPNQAVAQTGKVGIWADDGVGGQPGTLNGTGPQFTVAVGETANWKKVLDTADTPIRFVGENIWVGTHNGVAMRHAINSTAAGMAFEADTYADGTAAFSSPTSDDKLLAVVVDYVPVTDPSEPPGDSTPPTVLSSFVQENELVMQCSEPMADPSTVTLAALTVSRNGGIGQTPTAVRLQSGDPSTLVWTLPFFTRFTDVITWAYTAP